MELTSIKNIRLGQVLKEAGYVTEEDIGKAIEYQKQNPGMRIGNALIELNYITEGQMLEALVAKLNLTTVDLSGISVDIDAVSKIPRQLAEKYLMLAVSKTDEEGMSAVCGGGGAYRRRKGVHGKGYSQNHAAQGLPALQ